jgi:hypothetical protein
MVFFFHSIVIVDYFWYAYHISFTKTSTHIINTFIPQEEIADKSDLGEEHKYEITESMRQEMEYNADRAWYVI